MSNLKFIIRDATFSDVETILELIHLKAEFDGCLESVEATPERLKNHLFGDRAFASVLLADVLGKTIGFATYHQIYSTFLTKPGIWLDDLYIKPEFRNQKVGYGLMLRLCEIAQIRGCGRIDWTVNISNSQAIQFYEKIGANISHQVRLCRLTSHAISSSHDS